MREFQKRARNNYLLDEICVGLESLCVKVTIRPRPLAFSWTVFVKAWLLVNKSGHANDILNYTDASRPPEHESE